MVRRAGRHGCGRRRWEQRRRLAAVQNEKMNRVYVNCAVRGEGEVARRYENFKNVGYLGIFVGRHVYSSVNRRMHQTYIHWLRNRGIELCYILRYRGMYLVFL
jgi:hypothetical protein